MNHRVDTTKMRRQVSRARSERCHRQWLPDPVVLTPERRLAWDLRRVVWGLQQAGAATMRALQNTHPGVPDGR